jgi:hypothetical protein
VRPRLLQVVVDSRGPLDAVGDAVLGLRAWAHETGLDDLAIGLVVFGRRATWIPDGSTKGPRTNLASSAAVRGVGVVPAPVLAGAFELVASAGADALVTMLASEPAPGWEEPLARIPARFRACVSLRPEPAAAVGRGHLGAPFRGEHLELALRWITRELYDRTWRCACGALRSYPLAAASACDACQAPPAIPPRLRISDRVVLLNAGARLYPHHVGRALAFDAPLAELDAVLPAEVRRDGVLTIAGVEAELRTTQPPSGTARRSPRFHPPRLIAVAGQCHACEGPLAGKVLHEPPDPRRFCSPCADAEPRCDFCMVPVGPAGGNAWPDGRKACRDCWTTAVTESVDLATLATQARAWMKKRLGMEMPDCPLHFEHAAMVARMQGNIFRAAPGFNARAIGFFRKPIDADAALFIEHGTPKSLTYGIVVHELTNLWQWHNWARDQPLTISEGLAMWVEYQALLDVGAIHMARHTERYGDPVYGLGFRIALAVEKDVGFDRVKDCMQQAVMITPA